MARKFHPCHIPRLTPKQAKLAYDRAQAENPHRWPAFVTPAFLAVERRSWWGDKGKIFSVGFAKNTPADLKSRVLTYANKWAEFANVKFVDDDSKPIVRISFGRGGYWSYMGTDILGIPDGEQTMNLEGINSRTSDEECDRVIVHEFGHTIGCPHEHMRPELVAQLDPRKTKRYFQQTQGWSAAEVEQQVLTPINEKSLFGTEHSDETSIMCYQLPGSITKDGKPIRGGDRINANDAAFIATIYPKPGGPVLPPVSDGAEFVLDGQRYRVTKVGAA
jgi:hypothetical protein